MTFKTTLLAGAAAITALAVAGAADAGVKTPRRHHAATQRSALEQKVETLSAAVSDLEARLNDETQSRQALQAEAQAAKADAAAAHAAADAAQAQLAEQIQTIPGEINSTVNTAVAANKPKTDKIYYKGVGVTLGGFLAAETIYQSRNDVADISSNYAKIPYGNQPFAHTGETRGTARQSRVSFLAQGDVNPTTHAGFYGEFDFQAGPQTGNSNQSNSFSPRIRNIYGQLDYDDFGVHILAGQNWSLLTLNSKGITPRNEVTPPSIDAQYVPGFAWARQPQIRIAKDFDNKQLWIAASIENPQTTFGGTAGSALPTGIVATTTQGAISGFDSANSLSFNHVPDIIGKVAFEPQIGAARPIHVEAFGIWRDYYDRVTVASGNALAITPGAYAHDTNGGGFGGSVNATVIPKMLDVQGSILTGRGIGRYGSAGLPDATLRPNGEIAPIPETMWLVGATAHVTPTIDVYVFDGQERENAKYAQVGSSRYGFGYVASNFSPAACTNDTAGASCSATTREVDQIAAGVWDKVYTGSFGQVRIGLEYSHTELKAFAGPNGYAPHTSDDMVFTSFRYYPF